MKRIKNKATRFSNVRNKFIQSLDVGSPTHSKTGRNGKMLLSDKFSKLRVTSENLKSQIMTSEKSNNQISPVQTMEQSQVSLKSLSSKQKVAQKQKNS